MKRVLILAAFCLLPSAFFAQSKPAPSQSFTLLASAARTATGTGAATTAMWRYSTCQVILNVTAAATEAGDTLDVFLEKSPDNGATWDSFLHFTPVLGNGGAKKYLALVSDGISPTLTTTYAPKAHGDVAAGNINQGPFGDRWRVAWDITDGAPTNASFTFSVTASCK